MSLINCIQKLNKNSLAPEDKQELMRRVTEHAKTMDRPAAEKAAVRELLEEAQTNHEYLAKEIKKEMGTAEPVKVDEPLKAEAEPGNKPEPAEEVPLGGTRAAREASVVDGVSSAAHDIADRYLGSHGHGVITNTAQVLRSLVGRLEPLDAIVTRVAPHMPAAKTWRAGLNAKEATRGKIEQQYERVAQLASPMSDASRLRAGRMIEDATLSQAWPHQPKDLGRVIKVDPKMAEKFNKLTPEEQRLVDEVFTVNEQIGNTEQALLESKGASGIFANRARLTGPYAHIARTGDFTATLKSKTMLDAEQAKNVGLIKALKADPKHYVFTTFDTPSAAQAFVRANKDKFAFADASTKLAQLEDRNTMNPQVLSRLLASVGADHNTPKEVRAAMEESIRSIYLSTLDRNSAQQANRERLGAAGGDIDLVNTMLQHGKAKASYIANVAHGAEINNAFYQLKNEVAHPETGHKVGADDFNLLAAHHKESMQYNPTPIQDGVVAATSVMQLATSLGYHLQNFSQTVMVTLPKLAADFGSGKYTEAWGHTMDGYKQMRAITNDRGMTIDISKVKNEGLRNALEYAGDLQLLDVGMAADLKHFQRFRTGSNTVDTASGYAARAVHKLRQVSSAVERWNRVSAGTAAYNMALANGKSPAAAKDYMVSILRETQGDFTYSAKPLILKQLPKIVGQYRNFQLMMAAYYTKAFVSMFKGATAEERAIGRRMLGFKLLHTGVASGVLGMPMMNIAGMVYDAVGGGPDDLETALSTGDKDLDQLLHKGVGSFIGLDMSDKLSDKNIFSIAPYTKFDISSKTGLLATAAGVAGGPATGLATRMASGIGMIQQGDMYKGAEKLVPKGFEMAMQSFRLANEGYTMKNGDLLVKPEDLSTFGLMLTAAGLPSTEVKQLQGQEGKQYVVTKHFTDKSKDLQRQYLQAHRAKDTEAMADLRAKWMELQREKDAQRKHFKQMPDILKHQPLATLLDVPDRAAQRAQKAQGEFLNPS